MGVKRWTLTVALAVSVAGCSKPEDPAERAELEQVKRESAALNAELDNLGTRLLVSQQRVTADADLKERHQKVSEVACQNLSDHWSGINRFLENQRDKEHKKRVARVAAAEREQSD